MQLVTSRIFRSLLALISAGILFANIAHASALAVNVGQSVKLAVSVQGSAPFTYQWRKNGTAISGATSATYTINPVTAADAATYTVVVTNSVASTASDSAVLTVNAVVVAAPTITNQPASVTVTAGQPASFSVAASGSGNFTYQWLKNGTAISGANSATYTIASTSTADSGSRYSVVVSNSGGPVTSNSATLSVNAAISLAQFTPLSFSARGENGTAEGLAKLFDGQTSTKWLDFSGTTWVQIVVSSPAVLQAYSLASANDAPERDPASWTLSGSNDGVTWTVIETRSGQSWSSRYLSRDFVVPVSSAAYTRFRFDFQSTSGPITQLAELDLYGTSVTLPPAAPTITNQPAAVTVTAGQPASFSVAASGSGNFAYQWLKNGTAISGANSATYTIASTSTTDSGSRYSVVVSNSGGSVTSNSATLSVNAASTLIQLTPLSVSARGENGTAEGLAKLFDGQTSTKWLDFTSTTWVQITVASPTILQAYSLTSANDAPERDPASWTLSGSNDGVTWTIIETRSGQSWSSRYLSRDFVVPASSTAYTRFRFDFQASSGAITQLAELELFGVTSKPTASITDFVPSSYSARGQNGPAEGIAQLFDGQAATKWLDFSATTWVQFNLTSPRSLQVYTLTSANDFPERDPASWTLSGSNDGTTWTVIETRAAQSWGSRFLPRSFVLTTPSAAYSRFRFDFQSTSGPITQLAEVELSGAP